MTSSNLKLPALNSTTFAGRLTGNVEPLPASRGSAVTFDVELRRERSTGGSMVRIPCLAWGAIAEAIGKRTGKRAAVLVTGSLSNRGNSKVFVKVGFIQFLDDDVLDAEVSG